MEFDEAAWGMSQFWLVRLALLQCVFCCEANTKRRAKIVCGNNRTSKIPSTQGLCKSDIYIESESVLKSQYANARHYLELV